MIVYEEDQMKYKETYKILNVQTAVTNMEKTLCFLESNMEELRGEYICVSNVHTTVMAYEDANYREIQNGAAMVLPDGKPLAVLESVRGGFREAEKVSGPDLMPEVFCLSEKTGYRHFFYGSTEQTLKKLENNLVKKYPHLQIAGMYAPPFRQLTEKEDQKVIRRINEAKPDFLWVGLGAPKQEIWMAAHKNKISAVMIGVGAGFDFHAGVVKRAPVWMQKCGLEWLYRLFQDPKRLWKRYVVTNSKFVWYLVRGK